MMFRKNLLKGSKMYVGIMNRIEKGESIVAEPNSGSYNFGDSSWVLEIPQD